MKKLAFILMLLCAKIIFSQTTFNIDNFSNDYVGKLYIEDTTEVFSQGWVAIYDKKTKKELLKVESDELTFELHDGKILANIVQTPYGEQSQIIYEDFNFDGVKDFAIMDGQNSCYHGPSFQIYLNTNKKLVYSDDFTRLSQEYCGMFMLDKETETISTMTKSGCCWHQYSEFKVKNNKPYPIKIIEQGMDVSGMIWNYDEENLIDGKMVKTSYKMLDNEYTTDFTVLSFELENHKKMYILNHDDKLYYVFTNSEDKIELFFEDSFKYDAVNNVLSFKNLNTEYFVYSDKIVAKTPKNTYNFNAIKSKTIGNLDQLKNRFPSNLTK